MLALAEGGLRLIQARRRVLQPGGWVPSVRSAETPEAGNPPAAILWFDL